MHPLSLTFNKAKWKNICVINTFIDEFLKCHHVKPAMSSNCSNIANIDTECGGWYYCVVRMCLGSKEISIYFIGHKHPLLFLSVTISLEYSSSGFTHIIW